MLLVGYFEEVRSERGICWRCSDSLSLREFIGLQHEQSVPDHSTLSRTRQRYDEVVYTKVFDFALKLVAKAGLLEGRVVGVDSTYLQADASMRAIVRRDSGQDYLDYLKDLARESGIAEPTAEDARRLDRRRPGKRTSNRDWASPTDPDSRVVRMKDGRTRLGYKAEHVVDLDSGAIVGAGITLGDSADTETVVGSVESAAESIDEAQEAAAEEVDRTGSDAEDRQEGSDEAHPLELVADKGYHSNGVLSDLTDRGVRTYIPERVAGQRRRWRNKPEGPRQCRAYHQNRARIRRSKGKRYQRLRGELLERSFAHVCETGGGRRVRVRGLDNVWKSHIMRVVAFNLGLVMRSMYGYGAPRSMAEAISGHLGPLIDLLGRILASLNAVMPPRSPFGGHQPDWTPDLKTFPAKLLAAPGAL